MQELLTGMKTTREGHEYYRPSTMLRVQRTQDPEGSEGQKGYEGAMGPVEGLTGGAGTQGYSRVVRGSGAGVL